MHVVIIIYKLFNLHVQTWSLLVKHLRVPRFANACLPVECVFEFYSWNDLLVKTTSWLEHFFRYPKSVSKYQNIKFNQNTDFRGIGMHVSFCSLGVLRICHGSEIATLLHKDRLRVGFETEEGSWQPLRLIEDLDWGHAFTNCLGANSHEICC